MHNNEPTTTLLQVFRDLSRTVQQMAQEQSLTAIERDLLLAEMQQLYARLLDWPVAAPKGVVAAPEAAPQLEVTPEPTATEPVAVVAPEPEMQSIALHEQVAAVTEEVMEQLAEVVEEAVEEALESGKEVELDIQLQVTDKTDEQPEAIEEASAAPEPTEEVEAITEAPQPVEVAAVTAPAPAAVAPAARSVAFSLSGILQKNGDSQLVMAHLKLKPIDDLKSGIGLNEKFLFIRELFNNDHLAYADAIEQLNASNTLQEAENILAEKLLPVYQWDLETEAAVSFLHLIFRRFAPQA
ncbi:MAG: hypothetical protein C0424_07720 [Sphingobacteriaceae bacterium]|nr:hypothetical protein [Sphingobacteriaceae bacterium]